MSALVAPSSQALAPLSLADVVEAIGLRMPQVEAPVSHHFGAGVYMREVFLPASRKPDEVNLVVGRHHKQPHRNIMVRGSLLLLGEDGAIKRIDAPWTGVTSGGRKMAIVLEDTVWINVVATDMTDVEVIEEMMFDDSVAFKATAAQRFAAKQVAHAVDRADFDSFLVEFQLSADFVRAQSERNDDMVPMPTGEGTKVVLRKSPIEGRGVFATSPVAAGEVIGAARIGDCRTMLGRYVNHAKTPNACYVRAVDGLDLVALRPIAGCVGGDEGEEVTVDYRQAVTMAASLGGGA